MAKPFWHASHWRDDLSIAEKVAAEAGCKIEAATADYQTAKLIGDGVRLVIYPHKTSAGNRHLRVRDENSSDKARAMDIAQKLSAAAGHNCTFHMNNVWVRPTPSPISE